MKSLRWFGLLLILGFSGVATHAQTVAPDPTILFQDPDCSGLPLCAELTYVGATGSDVDLFFLVPAPPGYLPANPPAYDCETNIAGATVHTIEETGSQFNGCFFEGPLTNGDEYTISADAPVTLTIPEDNMNNPLFTCVDTGQCPGGDVVNISPEPGTALLYTTGLLVLVGFVRRRFGADSLT